jgi:hypothetical protein
MAVATSSSPLRIVTSLRLGERVLTRCDDGLLLAEYSLFDVSDIVLRATDPVTVREVGYMTTAGEALERLARAGVTMSLAEDAARALAPEVARSFARGATARSLAGRLGPQELFDGAIFSASAQRYEGACCRRCTCAPRSRRSAGRRRCISRPRRRRATAGRESAPTSGSRSTP